MNISIRDLKKKKKKKKRRNIFITGIDIKNIHEQAESNHSLHEQAIHVRQQHTVIHYAFKLC